MTEVQPGRRTELNTPGCHELPAGEDLGGEDRAHGLYFRGVLRLAGPADRRGGRLSLSLCLLLYLPTYRSERLFLLVRSRLFLFHQPGVGRGSAASSKPRGRGFRPKPKKPGARHDGSAPRQQQQQQTPQQPSWQSGGGGGEQHSVNSGVRVVGCRSWFLLTRWSLCSDTPVDWSTRTLNAAFRLQSRKKK